MKTILNFSLIAVLFLSTAAARTHATEIPASAHESIEWCDIWISHANETNLPRVLLIGDSITRDYYPSVEKDLEGKAYVARLSTSRFVSDPVLRQEIAVVLDNNQFQVIHFNNGMHGWLHSEAEYKKAFPKLVLMIKAHAPKATLIFATTTTLKESTPSPQDKFQPTNERVAARNAIAVECLKEKNIPVDDLCKLCLGHPEYHRDNVHFNEQGIAVQSRQVAGEIEKLLKP